jgi:2-polyprenyl-3-methyl-5-hydroxy-6-metoxy-1,4-benzoquinol methylase
MTNPFETLLQDVKCDICGGTETSPFLLMKDHLYDVPGEYFIVKCPSCGLLFTNPRPSPQLMNRFYEKYYGDFEDTVESYRGSPFRYLKKSATLRRFYHLWFGNYLSELLCNAKGRVLDVGCGSGYLLEEMFHLGCQVYGIEPNPKAAEACVRKGLDVQCGVLDEINYPEGFFDTVILWHVIEHLWSPKKTLMDIYGILKPGGNLFIYCPNADSYLASFFGHSWAGFHMPFHLYHFTPQSMKSLLAVTPFEIKRLRAVTPDLLFHKSLKASFSYKTNLLIKGVIEKGFFNLPPIRVMMALSFRIFDLCFWGKGECLQIELHKQEKSFLV